MRLTRTLGPAAMLAFVSACRMGAVAGSDSVAIGYALEADTAVQLHEYHAMLAARDWLNNRRPSGSPPFSIRVHERPAGTFVQIALRMVGELRDDASVVAAVGPMQTLTTVAVTDIIDDAERDGARALTYITPTASGPILSGLSPWVFQLTPSDRDLAARAVDFAVDSLRVQRAAIVYPATVHGAFWLRFLRTQLARHGIQVVTQLPHGYSRRDASGRLWDLYARDVIASRAQVIFMPGMTFWRDLRNQIRARGKELPFIVGEALPKYANDAAIAGSVTPSFAPLPGDSTHVTDSGISGMLSPTFSPKGEPRISAFLDSAYRHRHGASPTVLARLHFDATALIGLAVLDAGVDRRKVRAWLASLGRSRPPWEGATGAVWFDSLNARRGVTTSIYRAP